MARKWRSDDGPDWRTVVFTDETTINRASADMKRTQYLPEGYPFTELRMQPTASHGGGGINLWAAICPDGILAWHIFDTLDSKTYIKIITTKLLRKARDKFDEEDWILQQDGDPAHTSKTTRWKHWNSLGTTKDSASSPGHPTPPTSTLLRMYGRH